MLRHGQGEEDGRNGGHLKGQLAGLKQRATKAVDVSLVKGKNVLRFSRNEPVKEDFTHIDEVEDAKQHELQQIMKCMNNEREGL